MGMFTKSEVEAMRDRVQGKAPPPTKRRARVGTGDLAKRKRWYAEMARGPGIFLPLVTKSEANMRDKWATIKRAQVNRDAAYIAIRAAINRNQITTTFPLTITITRYSTKLLDDDNLARSAKNLRDGIAEAIGIDDGSPLYSWVYKQEKGVTYGIRIELTPLAAG